MGLSMQQVGADTSAALGGNFVNRFQMDGRSKRSFADRAIGSPHAGAAHADPHHRPERAAHTLSAVATPGDSVEAAYTGIASSSSTSVKLSGVATQIARGRSRRWRRRRSSPAATRVDFTRRASTARMKFLLRWGSPVSSSSCSCSGAVRSFRDRSSSHDSVPLRMFGHLPRSSSSRACPA